MPAKRQPNALASSLRYSPTLSFNDTQRRVLRVFEARAFGFNWSSSSFDSPTERRLGLHYRRNSPFSFSFVDADFMPLIIPHVDGFRMPLAARLPDRPAHFISNSIGDTTTINAPPVGVGLSP